MTTISTLVVVILFLVVIFVAASVVLSRTVREVDSAREDEYLELEGFWIRYRVTGGGPPVVLVHGWLSSGRIWEEFTERLAQRFTVYTLDLTGFGDSDKPLSGYGLRYGSRLLYAFCAHFGLTRATVIGHDVGGAMVVKLAADHPDMVGRLVLVATPADDTQIDLPTLLWLTTVPVIGPVLYTLGRFLSPLRRLWLRPFVLDPDDLTEETVDDAGKSTPAALTKTLSVMRREISRGRLVRQAGVVKVPVLIIAGEDDQIVDPQAASDWARTLPAEVVFLNGCGHLPMLERPDEFDTRILAFLTGDPSYLDATGGEATEEITGEGVTETPEEQPFFTWTKPKADQPGDDPPATRDRDDEDPSSPPDASSPPPYSAGSDDAERRPRDRAGDDIIPEVPKDLFEWPDSLNKPQPWEDRPWDDEAPDRRVEEEERDEDADPEDPEREEPRP